MKRDIFKFPSFLLLIFLGFACKNQQKAVVTQAPLGIPSEQTEQNTFPAVSSIRQDYLLQDSSLVRIYLKIDVRNVDLQGNSVNLNSVFTCQWTLQPDIGIREKLKSGDFKFETTNSAIDGESILVYFDIPRLRDREQASLFLELIDASAGRKFTNETFVNFTGKRASTRFGIFEPNQPFPVFTSALVKDKTYLFKSFYGNGGSVFIRKFEYDSGPALSPMSDKKNSELDRLTFSSTMEIKDGEALQFEKEGSYFYIADTSSTDGAEGFLVTNPYFPRLVNEEELLGPLYYMSTNKEIKALIDTVDTKDKLDLYFLGLTDGNSTQAKNLIRSYYRRIAQANALFTTYKEGWKTDQGMVFTIIGPPGSIQKNGRREVWIYNQSQSLNPIYFTFYRKPNMLTDGNFELVRYPEYGAYWYPFVEAWRSGSVLE